MSTTLPPAPKGTLLHHRTYDVEAYKADDGRLILRGSLHDQKPPGIYFDDDPEPLSVHLMVVELTLAFPALEIEKVDVLMDVTPHRGCSTIEQRYQQLVGLSIARGFSRKVKDLFGGPSGCTHIGALLQAMAPVAIQSMWSMRAVDETPVALTPEEQDEQRRRAMAFNADTCHIWARDGEQMARIEAGDELEPPVWAVERLEKLGRPADEWFKTGG
ncbi:MAG: DUF2889 domain-containing protein [Actinomycetota bacterium]